MTNETVENLPIFSIAPDPEQARKAFSEEGLRELADSIALNGVISPIIVTPSGEDTYRIIAGERRWRASLMAKKTSIPAIVRELEQLTEKIQSLIENIQRSDLNPMEEADAYQELVNEYDLSHEELAERVGKSRAYVTNSLRLQRLPSFVKDCLRDEIISNGHAKVLLSLDRDEDKIFLCGRIAEEGWSVKQTEEAVADLKEGKEKERKKSPEDPALDEQTKLQLEKTEMNLTRHFGTEVKLDLFKNNNGSLRIRFHDLEELQRILDLMDYQDV